MCEFLLSSFEKYCLIVNLVVHIRIQKEKSACVTGISKMSIRDWLKKHPHKHPVIALLVATRLTSINNVLMMWILKVLHMMLTTTCSKHRAAKRCYLLNDIQGQKHQIFPF